MGSFYLLANVNGKYLSFRHLGLFRSWASSLFKLPVAIMKGESEALLTRRVRHLRLMNGERSAVAEVELAAEMIPGVGSLLVVRFVTGGEFMFW